MDDKMIPILLEDLGLKYPTENSKRKYRYGLYQCQYCGKEFETQVQAIKNGNTKSCGCYQKRRAKEACTKHGARYHPLYLIWKSMKSRCSNLKDKAYPNYGGRGIKVCDRWRDVNNFIEDMYPSYTKELSIDRIDVNGNYEFNNCRWTDKETQQRNTRDIQVNNKSGFRGVSWSKVANKYIAMITVNYKVIYLGYHQTTLEAGKAYERYVRLHNLEHNYTPILTEEEIEGILL